MTEKGKSPKPNLGNFPSSLENAKYAFPTFPRPRLLNFLLNQNQKGAFLSHPSTPPSGSSFDWKRLVPRGFVDPSEQTGKDAARCEKYQTPSRHAGHMPIVSI